MTKTRDGKKAIDKIDIKCPPSNREINHSKSISGSPVFSSSSPRAQTKPREKNLL